MQEMLKKVITDILTTLYEPFWFALLSALLLTIAWKIQERGTFSGIVLLVLPDSNYSVSNAA